MISRMFLGTSDVFSGLFALERSVWDARAGRGQQADRARCSTRCSGGRLAASTCRSPSTIDSGRTGSDSQDLRPLKHSSTAASAIIRGSFSSAWSAPRAWSST